MQQGAEARERDRSLSEAQGVVKACELPDGRVEARAEEGGGKLARCLGGRFAKALLAQRPQ